MSHLVLCGMALPDGSQCLTGMDSEGAMDAVREHYTTRHEVTVPDGFRIEVACTPGALGVIFPILVPHGCEV